MRKILKNKKGAGDMNMAVIIAVIVGILVVAIIAVKVGPTIVEKVKDIFPEFGVQEEGSSEFSPDASNQPSELQGEDKCIGFNFYWSDSHGKKLSGEVEPGKVYIAINLPESAGNLEDEENECLDYGLVISEGSEIINKISFDRLKGNSEFPLTLNKKEFNLIPLKVEDPGLGKSGKYSFKIMKTRYRDNYLDNVRSGETLIVEKDSWLWGI